MFENSHQKYVLYSMKILKLLGMNPKFNHNLNNNHYNYNKYISFPRYFSCVAMFAIQITISVNLIFILIPISFRQYFYKSFFFFIIFLLIFCVNYNKTTSFNCNIDDIADVFFYFKRWLLLFFSY